MKNYFLLAVGLVLAVNVPGQGRSERRVAARVAEQKALSAFTRSTPFTPVGATSQREALVGPVVADATFMTASRTALAGMLAQPAEHLTLEIPTADGVIELDLVRAEIYSTGFSVIAASIEAPVEHTPGVHYRGIIAGEPGTLAAISIFPDEVMGFVSDATGNHVLGKLEGSTDEHIYYAERDLLDPPVLQCATPDAAIDPEHRRADQGQTKTVRCVDIYWEVNRDIYLDQGDITSTTNYITGLFNQHATLFDNDGISVQLSELFIWDVASPYTGTTTNALLEQFQAYRNGFNGDVGNLLGYAGSGGLAFLDGLCSNNQEYSLCYSGINDDYAGVPTYSWSVNVVTHEEGHVLGSPHTHTCAWNGDDTAIDGCGPSAGYPYEGTCGGAPIPADGGTIMSYCHLTPVGVNFNLGFGPQPAALINGNVDAALCLGACGVAGCDPPSGLWSDALANSATVSWTPVSGAISYTLQWRPGTLVSWTSVAGITATEHELTGLFLGSSYSFRVRTECAGGSSPSSPVFEFTTPCPLGTPCDDSDPFTETDIIVSDCVCAGTPPTPFQEIDKVVALDRTANARFGTSVAINGDYAIVGAIDEAGGGAAYIFVRSGSAWIQQQKIVASDRAAGDEFGVSVAIDGDYAIVGADRKYLTGISAAGAAYIFVRNGSTWSQQQKIIASDPGVTEQFGASVAIDGDHVIVGAPRDDGGFNYRGSAYIFVRNGNMWTQQQKIGAGFDQDAFGNSVGISGNRVIVGAPYENNNGNRGAAYIYVRNGTTWSLQEMIHAIPEIYVSKFGWSVAINEDRAIVGAPGEDPVWNLDLFVGAAYIFVRDGNNWIQQQRIAASDPANEDWFGTSVAIGSDHAIVGAPYQDFDATGVDSLGQAGAAYVFVRRDTLWTQLQKIVASDRAARDEFGISVAMDGDHAMVGAFWEDEDEFGNNTLTYAGSAYFLTNDTALVDITTGADVVHTATDLLVFPVPTRDVLNVLLNDTRAYRADVIGLDGRSVLPMGTIRSNTPVDVSALASGAYLLRITSAAHEVRYVRFVKE